MKLNFKNMWGAGVIVALFALLATMSFDRSDTEKEVRIYDADSGMWSDYTYAAPPKSYQKVIARDTMSAAGNTTVDIPWIMASPYQYNYYVRLRKLQHTPNVKVVLREANSTGSTLWSPIDSFTCSAADSTKVHFRLRGTHVYGARHQLLFVKTGTTTVQRDIILNIKPPNQ